MRLWSPKTRVEEKSWSVILNPLRSELDKRRVSEKISELFRLSFEEARELVQSTPLILLDELPQPIAIRVQDLFQGTRAEVTLTNDSLVKRRCYRAVWPEPPNLSFLDSPPPSENTPEHPLPEIPVGTAVETAPASPPEIGEKREPSLDAVHELERKYRELELLYEERTQENQELRETIERELKHQTEKGATELKGVVAEWEERYQNLKEEYQETRTIYEEKILAREKEFEALKAPLKEFEAWKERTAQLEKQSQDKYHTLVQKLERFESLYEEESKKREQVEASGRETSELVERTRRENQLRAAEAEHWQKKCLEFEENDRRLREELAQTLAEREAEIKRLREAGYELEIRLESSQRKIRELLCQVEQQELIEKRARLTTDLAAKEARLRELVAEGGRLKQDIQDRELQMQTLAGEQTNLEREILELKQSQRYLLEQSKLKEKGTKLRRQNSESSI